MDGKELIGAFESLGDNCDFGFVQQFYGHNPITLLRWAGCSLDGLVRALEADFADLFRWQDVRPSPPSSIYDAKYDLFYHVELDFDGDSLRSSESNVVKHRRLLRDVRFRLRLFLETLAERRKIMVYRSSNPLRMGDLLRLKSALDLHGPQKLLYVVAATQDRPAGSVARIASGVKVASLTTRAEDTAEPLSPVEAAAWLGVCADALAGNWGHEKVLTEVGPEPTVKVVPRDGWSRALHRVIS